MATPTKTYTITQLIAEYSRLVEAITFRPVEPRPALFPQHLEEAAEVLLGADSMRMWNDADHLVAAAAYVGDAIWCGEDEQQVPLRRAAQRLTAIDQSDYL